MGEKIDNLQLTIDYFKVKNVSLGVKLGGLGKKGKWKSANFCEFLRKFAKNSAVFAKKSDEMRNFVNEIRKKFWVLGS